MSQLVDVKILIADKNKAFIQKPSVLYIAFLRENIYESIYRLSEIESAIEKHHQYEKEETEGLKKHIGNLKRENILSKVAVLGGLSIIFIITLLSFLRLRKKIQRGLISRSKAALKYIFYSPISIILSIIFLLIFGCFEKDIIYGGELIPNIFLIIYFEIIPWIVITLFFFILLVFGSKLYSWLDY